MKVSEGKNQYKNNVFDGWEWSAPRLQTYEEALQKVKELKLEGRVIKNFYAVGMGYNWTDNDLGEAIYLALEKKDITGELPPEGTYPYFPEGVSLFRWAELDEPFLVEFEDGDILCLDWSSQASVRMELNTIPKDIRGGTNKKNFHPNALFSPLLGMEIHRVELTMEADRFREQGDCFAKINLVCTAGWDTWMNLEFVPVMGEYCAVTATDRWGPCSIPAPEARAVVEGFIPADILDSDDEYNMKNA